MDVYMLKNVSWWQSQCYYHALAYLGREGLILCYPDTPYLCLGLHDDLENEVDQEYCRKKNIPLLRRETGGGVVYLDSDQIFYQLVLERNNPLLPLQKMRFYKHFLQPAIAVYRKLGVPAVLNPPADIKADGRKCSGNAAGDIGQCTAYVGNILIDFDFLTMSNVLQLPGADFRHYYYQAMQSKMTTLSDWNQDIPDNDFISELLLEQFEALLGNLNRVEPDRELQAMAVHLRKKLTAGQWLAMPGRKTIRRRIKVAENIYLQECADKNGDIMVVLINNELVEKIYCSRSDSVRHMNNQYLGRRWDDLIQEGLA